MLKTKIERLVLVALVMGGVAGCATSIKDIGIMSLQNEATRILGLASTDEVAITDIQQTNTSDFFKVTKTANYRATTTKGRKFSCRLIVSKMNNSPTPNPPEKVESTTCEPLNASTPAPATQKKK